MAQTPYSSYHGRKRWGRSFLIGVIAALLVILAAVLAGYYLGLFNIPTADNAAGGAPGPQVENTSLPSSDPVVETDAPSAPPAQSPAPEKADLSGFARRELVLGLVPVTREQLLAGSAALPARQGAFVDMSGADLTADAEAVRSANKSLPYAAAYVDFDPADDLTALAGLGFDEIVLSSTVPADNGQSLADAYRKLRAGLDAAGWKGRLSLVLDQSLAGSGYAADLMAAIGGSFDRLFFKNSLQAGVKTALVNGGFDAAATNIVTVYGTVPSVNWAWAILPR